MIDRERAIEAAMAANGWCSSEWRISAERIVDAVLAFPIVVDDAMVECAAGALWDASERRDPSDTSCRAECCRPECADACCAASSLPWSSAGWADRLDFRADARAALEAALNPPEGRP